MKILLISIAILNIGSLLGQKIDRNIHDLRIPKNIDQCFDLLGKTMTDEEIAIIKTYPEDSIFYHDKFRNGTGFFHAWKLYDGSRLTRYFNKRGLQGSHEIYNTILISYHRYLNEKPILLEDQIANYQALQRRQDEAFLLRIQQDSINGIYIPMNLEDCFQTLNFMLKKEDIEIIKNLESREEVIQFHHGFGTWLRNNWGLWGGSRLQQYLIGKGLNHPDEMTHLIFEFYYDWLNDSHSEWKKFEEKEK